ncbi:MAG: phage major capsid protein [Azonexus sp.]|nr:phage major capsid protein [Azonexus sp.]
MSLTRQHRIEVKADDTRQEGDDLVVELSFASQTPYERWWGIEVLDCSPASVRLERINNGGALLYNHNWDELRGHHLPGSVVADGDKVRGQVAIAWAADDGKTVKLVQGGHLTQTSTGYEIHQIIEQSVGKSGEKTARTLDGQLFDRVLTRCQREAPGDLASFRRALDSAAGAFERAANEPTTYRVTDWEILENSLVTVPADTTVGLGRSRESETPPAEPEIKISPKEQKMPEVITPEIDVAAIERAATDKANKRVSDIGAMADQFKDYPAVRALADAAIRSGQPADEVKDAILAHVSSKGHKWDGSIGMSQQEAQRFSVVKAIKAMIDGDWTDAGLEREASKAIADKIRTMGVERSGSGKGFFLPLEVQQRDMLVATAANGGNMVATTLRPQDFIGLLRARTLSTELGVRRLSGLVGNADITKQTGGATGYWLASESTAITESQQTIGLLQLRPKNLGAYTEVTRQLLLQSTPDADMFVMDDLAKQLGVAIDAAIFNGSGASGQPTGIIGTAGVGSVVGTSLGLAGCVEFQTDVAAANALNANCRYVTTPAVAGLLTQRARIASTDSVTLWKGNILDGNVEGYQAHTSNNIPAATMLFGDFSQVILAEWGVLEIDVNPYANFTAGITGIRAFYTCDVGVRVPGAFSVAASIT